MSDIVILSGSPAIPSRTDISLKHIQSLVENAGFTTAYFSITDFSADDLFQGKYNREDISKLSERIQAARGVIIGSPVYKASYTGVLKALIDLLPEGAFKGKPVLPIMIGGSNRHLLAIDYALKPLISILKGEPLQGIYFVDKEIDKQNPENPINDLHLIDRVQSQVQEFVEAIQLRN
ncbi:NADPH-dependent FMN reductase [Peribacillus frigoritolerans]|uniref:NADPH-dependent FMN reductase n=1 Tax=Peribacillus frigoritolerans TaxID=450367 RepID=UPI00222706FD|nr:NADPH-dependent FMN reductase [Peribacillus frigoritolerans]UYY96562.1 NADPH-dependent FMN reductase [Peribacillus frigoritolerans]